jgi:hypothetical protein
VSDLIGTGEWQVAAQGEADVYMSGEKQYRWTSTPFPARRP